MFTTKQKAKYVRDGGDDKHEFQSNVHLGKSKIAQLFKKGAQILGLEEPDQFYPHSLRAMFITSLTNSGLNADEIKASARHTSFASSASYIVSDGQSENDKFKALGMIASPKKTDSTAGDDVNGECLFISVCCCYIKISYFLPFVVFCINRYCFYEQKY